MTETSGPGLVPEGDQDDHLLRKWHGKLTREIQGMRDCGPLEAMKKLDGLVRSAFFDGGPQDAQALGLAWVRVLAGPPETLTIPVIRAAGSLHIQPAGGPLLAHVYGDGFWPALSIGDPESRFTDLQRRAILLALIDLTPLSTGPADTLEPIVAAWLIQRAIPLWRKSHPGALRRFLGRFVPVAPVAAPHPVQDPPESAPPVPGLTLRELRSHAFVLGYICPRDQVIPYATVLSNCPAPLHRSGSNSDGKKGEQFDILTDGLHAEFLRGWLTRRHQASVNGHPERLIQTLPTPFATDGRLLQRIAAELENDFARRPNPLKSNRDFPEI